MAEAFELPRCSSHPRPDGTTEFSMAYQDRRVEGVLVPHGAGAVITYQRYCDDPPPTRESIRVADEHGAIEVLRSLFAWTMTGQ